MNGWFDVLLAPSRFLRDVTSHRFTAEAAVALLLDGQLSRYLALADEAQWPAIEQAASPEPTYRLPAALLLQLTGAADPEMYKTVVTDVDRAPTERAVAAALLSALYADAGALGQAIDSLQRLASTQNFAGLELAYIYTHIGLRCIEAGDWERAADSCSAALGILAESEPESPIRQALRNINRGNQYFLDQVALGKFAVQTDYARNHLFRIDQLTAAALEEDLDRTFKARFSSINVTTIHFKSDDAAERSLWGALLRSEALGDVQAINRARRNIGRYLITSAVAIDQRSPDSGFRLLLRAGDADRLAQATRVYLERGPLSSVVGLASEVAQAEWPPLLVTSCLKVLTQAADVLNQDKVEPLLRRLCRDYSKLVRPIALTRAESDLLSAIASVTRVAPPDVQSIAATFALTLAQSTHDALTLQSIPDVLRTIDWSNQHANVVEGWMGFIRESLGGKDDAALLAESAFFSLLPSRSDELLVLVRAVRPGSIVVAVAAVQTGSAADLSDQEVEALGRELVSILKEIREGAARGSFSWGGAYDPGGVLAILLLKRSELSLWGELIDYVADPKVPRAHKLGAVRALTDNFSALPKDVREAMSAGFAGISAADNATVFASPSFESTLLRLGSELGMIGPDRVLLELLRLASSASPALRVQAASAAASVKLSSDLAGLSVVLLLSRDSDTAVRAAACRAIVIRPWGDLKQEEALVWPRIVELLSEGGREPTLGVLRGLYEGVDARAQVPQGIASRVGLLATDHPSWSIRTMAQRLISRWRETRKAFK